MHALRVMAAMLAIGASVLAGEPAAAPPPRVLHLCLVDAAQNVAADAAFQRRFAQRIGELAASSAAEEMRLDCQQVSGRDAAARLKRGACDAVLVVGPDRPRALQRIDAVAFAGALGWQRSGVKLYLILSNDRDARLRDRLAAGFHAAISAEAQPERKVALR